MILFFLFLHLALPVLSTLEHIRCSSPSNFDVDLSNGNTANAYETELSVIFPRDKVRVYTYPHTDAVNILLNGTIIIFKGKLSVHNFKEQSREFNHAVHLQAKGFGKLKNDSINSISKLQECQMYLTWSENDGLDIPRQVKRYMREFAENCMRLEMCTKIGSVQPEDYAVSTNPDEFGPLSVYSRSQNQDSFSTREPPLSNESTKSSDLQLYISTVVGIVMAEVEKYLKEKREERSKIPDIHKKFSVGSSIFKTNGHFNATDGYVSDLTISKRTSAAVVEKQGLKFSLSCSLEFSTARIEYDHYKLKFGIIKVSGKLSADIKEISIHTKVSVDYNENPCKANLEYLKIVDPGKVKIKVTGLGPLNSLTSFLVTWITKEWQTDIVRLIETKVKNVVNHQLNNFNWEKYRP